MADLSLSRSQLLLLAGTANRPLAEEMAKHLGQPLCAVTIRRFADGEIFVKIDENVRGRDVFIIQPTNPPAENHLELLFLIDAARRASAARTTVVAPDVGSAKMARGFAKRLNASLAIIDKRRPSANVAEVVNVVGEVADKDCLIPDDMIDTAGTITEAAAALKRLGARQIYAFATHALLSGPAVERLRASEIDEVVVANTILIPEERRFERLKVLSIAGLMAKAIGYEHSNQSVSSLFD
jgi:ribose-phosphate pyrophosphokinase